MDDTLTIERVEDLVNDVDPLSEFIGGVARVARSAVSVTGRGSDSTDLSSGTHARVFRHDEFVANSPLWKLAPPRGATFVALHSWEGVVEAANPFEVQVRIFDLVHKENPEVTTSISMDEIDMEDRDLIVSGAVFYWSVGYSQSSSGRRRSSVIRFRRLPAWTRSELSRAREEADRLVALFGAAHE